MKTVVALSSLLLISAPAYAQVKSNLVLSPGSTVTKTVEPAKGTVTTTVQSPESGVTTQVVTPMTKSSLFNLKDGRKLEVDYDGATYIVYADGARITAPDGIHLLQDNTAVTVKDGKRVP